MIWRALLKTLMDRLVHTHKIIVLYGPRQVGKTTLVHTILSKLKQRSLFINADEEKYQKIFSSKDFSVMNQLIVGYEVLAIDEAQRIPDIGINLKILHEHCPDLKIIVTGSSAFDLSQNIQEPLTGRKLSFNLFPIAYCELSKTRTPFELNQLLNNSMIYGLYPELFLTENVQEKYLYLKELATSYLYKDILEMSGIKFATKLKDLLRLLAYQVGSQVSLTELGQSLSLNKETVEHYIDLLEKTFVIFRLTGFSRNLRKEVTKMNKIYFYDLGIRNMVIDNFSPMSNRNDRGQLWENFLMVERKKRLAYDLAFPNTFFWRTYTGAELDYIEETSGILKGYEFKNKVKSTKPPRSWLEAYPEAQFQCINPSNFLDFILT